MPGKYRNKDPYWEREQPREARTRHVLLSYYPAAGKLQIATIFEKDGQTQRAKVVTLDQEDIALHPEARELILEALEGWR